MNQEASPNLRGRLLLAWLPKHATKPKNNASFWRRKLFANKKRDRLVTRTLRRADWRVIRVWECTLAKHPETCIRRILEKLGVED